MNQELILKEEVYAVVGAAMEVYNELVWIFGAGVSGGAGDGAAGAGDSVQ
jgi:hypothetical protein